MTRPQRTVLIIGSVAIVVGATGLLTHSPWSDIINVSFLVFGTLVNLIQLLTWLPPAKGTRNTVHDTPKRKRIPPSNISNTSQYTTYRAASTALDAQTSPVYTQQDTPPHKSMLLGIVMISVSIFLLILFIISLMQRNQAPVLVKYFGGSISNIHVGGSSSAAQIQALAWSPDDRYIATTGNDGKVRVWDVMRKRAIFTYTGHKGPVYALAWSHDGTRIASAGSDDTVQVWAATTGHIMVTYRGHNDAVNAVAWSPHDTRIASASDDDTVQVWDVIDAVTVCTYIGHHSGVESLAWSPDGNRIASVANDSKNEVQVWDATTGSHVLTYSSPNPKSTVNRVAWSPDNTRIAFNVDDTVEIRDATTLGKTVTIVCSGNNDMVDTITWSPDSKYIASGRDNNTVKVCDSTTGDNIATYITSSTPVSSLAWAYDDKRIATSGSNGTIQIWDALSGKQLSTFH
jgi:WD40 repeat protein